MRPEFIADFNVRFGKQPRNPKDMHRPLAAHENLDGAMCRKEVRTLSQSLTLRYDKVLFILDPTEQAKALAGKKVIVCDYPDGRLEIMHEQLQPCPTEPSTSCGRCIDPRSSRTSVWTTCFRSSPRCRPDANNNAARAALAAQVRRTICSAFPMAARAMVIRSVVASLAGGRIS